MKLAICSFLLLSTFSTFAAQESLPLDIWVKKKCERLEVKPKKIQKCIDQYDLNSTPRILEIKYIQSVSVRNGSFTLSDGDIGLSLSKIDEDGQLVEVNAATSKASGKLLISESPNTWSVELDGSTPLSSLRLNVKPGRVAVFTFEDLVIYE